MAQGTPSAHQPDSGACSAAKASGIIIPFDVIVSNELEALQTGDGHEVPAMLRAEIRRELDRIVLVTCRSFDLM